MNKPVPIRKPAAWQFLLAGLTFVAGVGLSVTAWHSRARLETAVAADEFRLECENLRAVVSREITLFLDVLDSLRQLHSLSDRISPAAFQEMATKGLHHQQSILGAYGFAQRISRDLRSSFEKTYRDSGMPDFVISAAGTGNRWPPAPDQPDYYPLTYQNPDRGLGLPLGFDFSSDPVTRAAIDRAAASGNATLGQATGQAESRGWYALAPILYPQFKEAPAGFLVGFTVAILRPAPLLARALRSTQLRGITCMLADAPQARFTPGPFEYDAEVAVADQRWRLRCAAGPAYLDGLRSGQPEIILAAGLLVTVLLTVLLGVMADRTRRIAREVHARTAALRQAHAQLEQEMRERLHLQSEISAISRREQQRVGRDLHDSLGQQLTGAIYLSRALQQRLHDGAAPAESEAAARITATLKEAVAQTRRIARGLAPVDIGAEGLADALTQLARDASELYGVECEFSSGSVGSRANLKQAEHLYQVAQEAISNAVRHGQATRITIALTEPDANGRLEISDDGRGFDPAQATTDGLGLQLMRYRASLLGGGLEIAARPGAGARVICHYRLDPGAPGDMDAP